MATILKTKNSVTTTVAPTSLAQGELAVNITDKKMWVGNAATTPVQIVGNGVAGGAGGSTTQVQYNSSGLLAGSANMTFSGTALTLANDASISGLTVGKGGGAVSTNTAVGLTALRDNTTGPANSAFGIQALYQNTTGGYNTALGQHALYSNNGDSNTAIGQYCLDQNTTGSNNVSVGQQASRLNTTGGSNTSVGTYALYSNTTASSNTAVGYQAGYSQSGASPSITAVGYQALYGNTTGTNDAFGYQALKANTTGDSNSTFGFQSLQANTTGSYNVASGLRALYANTTGSSNSAFGNYALQANTTASNNVAVGYNSGQANVTGTNNTYVGVGAGYYCTGSKNTILGNFNGNQSGLNISSSANYIVLSDGDGNPRMYCDGNGSWVSTYNPSGGQRALQLNNGSNISGAQILGIAVGAACNNTSSYLFVCSTGPSDKLYIYGNGNVVNTNNSYGTLSDIKLKENIVDASSKLDDVMKLKVRNFNLKSDPDHKQIGFVAQELEQVFPALIDNTTSPNDPEDVIKSVKTSVLVPILVKAIQELKAEVDSLKAQLGK